jgi:hypothetical protein
MNRGLRTQRRALLGGLLAGAPLVSTVLGQQQQTSSKSSCCAKLDAINFSSNLPVIIIESISGTEILYDEYQEVALCTCTPAGLAAEKDIEDYDGRAEIAGRGNSSADFEKTQFKIKLQDANGEKKNFPFLVRLLIDGNDDDDDDDSSLSHAHTVTRSHGHTLTPSHPHTPTHTQQQTGL